VNILLFLRSLILTVYNSAHEEGIQTPGSFETRENRHKWKGTIAKGIALMDAVIHSVNSEVSVEKFDGVVASITHNDSYYELHESSGERIAASLRPADVAQRLRELLTYGLRDFSLGNNQAIKQSGRPSKLIRYWLPMSVFIVCVENLCFVHNLRGYRCHQEQSYESLPIEKKR